MYKIIPSSLGDPINTEISFVDAVLHVLSPFILVAVINTPINSIRFLLLLLPFRY